MGHTRGMVNSEPSMRGVVMDKGLMMMMMWWPYCHALHVVIIVIVIKF